MPLIQWLLLLFFSSSSLHSWYSMCTICIHKWLSNRHCLAHRLHLWILNLFTQLLRFVVTFCFYLCINFVFAVQSLSLESGGSCNNNYACNSSLNWVHSPSHVVCIVNKLLWFSPKKKKLGFVAFILENFATFFCTRWLRMI